MNRTLRSPVIPTFAAAALLVAATAIAQHAGPQAHPAAATPGSPVALRFTYTAGRHTVYTTRSVQTAPPPVGETTSTARLEMDVLSVAPDGSAQMRIRLSSMDIQAAAIPPDVRQQIAQGMAGMTVTFSQDTRGTMSQRAEPTGVSPQFRPMVEGILQSLDQMSPQLPEAPVSIGGSWTEHKVTHVAVGSGTMDLAMDVTYTLRELHAGPHGSIAVLGVAITMTIPHGTLPITGGGSASGQMTLDLGQGILTASRTSGSMTMHVNSNGRMVTVPTSFVNEMQVANP